jgi:tetratricopeptide (TPR) repeat protein
MADWEKEKFSLEEKVKHVTEQISSLQHDSAGKLAEREKQLNSDKESARLAEESSLAQWRETETMLSGQRDSLMQEVSSWEKKIKDETAQYEKESRELDKDIEKLKLESALKDAGIQASRHKLERDWFKALRRLEGQLETVSRRYVEEKDSWTGRIHLVEEEINTFKVRLGMREDRRQAEITRRQDELRKIINELENEVKGMYARYSDAVLGKKEWVTKRSRQLEELRAQLAEKENVWQREQAAKEASLTGVFEQFGSDLSDMEKSLKEETNKFEKLLSLKQKQLQNIMAQMAGKEEELVREREFSQNTLSTLHTKAAEFKQQIEAELRALSAGKQEQRSHVRIFDEAMELYSQQNFGAALERLEALVRQHPRFPGALQYMALCSFEQGKLTEAVQFAERAFELDGSNESLKEWISQLKQAARSHISGSNN